MGMVSAEVRRIAKDAVLNRLAASSLLPDQLRWAVLRASGMSVERSKIAAGVWFGGRKIAIGRRAYINRDCFFDAYAPITIGANVRLGPQVMLGTSTHDLADSDQRGGAVTGQPIVVGEGSWLGARVTVLPGVTIAPGCVIAAGAVVTEDCLIEGLYAGVPARLKRKLD